jgi:hypothetical protein
MTDTDHDDTEADDFDPLDLLTIAELDAGSGLLKASLVAQIVTKGAKFEASLAVLAYLLARRTDHTAKLATFRDMRFTELQSYLETFRPPAGTEAGPTAPGPE